MGKSLEEQFEAAQVKRLRAQSPWNARNVYRKVFGEVVKTLENLTNDGKIHLKKSNWGYMNHVPESRNEREHFFIGLNFSGVSQEYSNDTERYSLRVPKGFAGLVARSEWMILGEAAFTERKAAAIMKKIAKAEAEYCQKNNIGPMPAIEALAEAAEIKDASKTPKIRSTRSASL